MSDSPPKESIRTRFAKLGAESSLILGGALTGVMGGPALECAQDLFETPPAATVESLRGDAKPGDFNRRIQMLNELNASIPRDLWNLNARSSLEEARELNHEISYFDPPESQARAEARVYEVAVDAAGHARIAEQVEDASMLVFTGGLALAGAIPLVSALNRKDAPKDEQG